MAVLRDLRATFVSACGALVGHPAFIGMHYLGFSINVVTLLALSLVIGVVGGRCHRGVENINRHLYMGKTPMQAG